MTQVSAMLTVFVRRGFRHGPMAMPMRLYVHLILISSPLRANDAPFDMCCAVLRH
jgi:hypothetical protein